MLPWLEGGPTAPASVLQKPESLQRSCDGPPTANEPKFGSFPGVGDITTPPMRGRFGLQIAGPRRRRESDASASPSQRLDTQTRGRSVRHGSVGSV